MNTTPYFSADSPLRLRNMRPKAGYIAPKGKNGRPYSVCSPELAQTFRILHAEGQGMKVGEIARRYKVDRSLVQHHITKGKDYEVPAWLRSVQQAVAAALEGDVTTAREKFGAAADFVASPPPVEDWRQLQLL